MRPFLNLAASEEEEEEVEEENDEEEEEEDNACNTSGVATCCGLSCILVCGSLVCFVLTCCMIIACWGVKVHFFNPGPPEACYNLPEKADFPAIEQRPVKTPDGVTLMMWRVPGDRSRPVLILSGLECSSRDWFTGLDDEALPWLLWKEGYDVWLGNNRGVYFSDTPHWDWSFIEMAQYDLPTMVDTVLADTGAPKLRALVGHSQGALQAFLHFSENATTANRVAHFAALSPAVYLTQQRYTWNVFAFLRLDQITKIAAARPGTAFATFEEMQRDYCWFKSWFSACWDCARDMGGSFMMGGEGFAAGCYDKFMCIPAGTSSDNLRAFADTLRSGSFQEFVQDHIGRGIDFTALPMPISLAVGDSDLFMKVQDVERIKTERGPGPQIDFWTVQGAGHMDLVWGTAAPDQVFRPLIERLKSRH